MKPYYLFVSLCLIFSSLTYGQRPVSHPDAEWSINADYSDEFNGGEMDHSKWNNDPNDWGTWSWEPENAYLTDTALTLQMVQTSHLRNGKDYFFTSGIIRHREKITYGYFETSIKATDKGQGTCPAFWLYSRQEPIPTVEDGVQYCEIDAIEIFQIPNQLHRLEMNLHTRIIENGELVWKRPGSSPDLARNTWVAPWDPRDEYHTYGVLNRLDSIFWYVDGIERGAKKNVYWHLPMHPTVSLGLRAPYEKYINGVRTIMPFPDSIAEPGFPTEMQCDYVRTWKTPGQLYADYEKYYNASFGVNETLNFNCRYFAGSGETILAEDWNGVTCKLLEIRADGTVVQEMEVTDASAIGKESGLAAFQFDLSGLTPSVSLPAGNQYILQPAFKSTQGGGTDFFLKEQYYPINILLNTNVDNERAVEKIKIISRGSEISVIIPQTGLETEVQIFSTTGKLIHRVKTSSGRLLISKTVFPVSGTYVVTVANKHTKITEKINITK